MSAGSAMSREQLDAIIANVQHMRELEARKAKLLDELVIALCFKHLWSEWADAKTGENGVTVRKFEVTKRVGVWVLRMSLDSPQHDRGDCAVCDSANGTGGNAVHERDFPLGKLPEPLLRHVVANYNQRNSPYSTYSGTTPKLRIEDFIMCRRCGKNRTKHMQQQRFGSPIRPYCYMDNDELTYTLESPSECTGAITG